jgi:hypothetical protein
LSYHRFAAATFAFAALATAPYALAADSAAQRTYTLKTSLSVRQEVRSSKGAAGASGVFSATLKMSGKKGTFLWNLRFKNLSGRAVAGQVQIAASGKSGPVAIPLCRPCTAGAHGSYTGPIGTNHPLLKALTHGGAYVNVLTKKNPKGEIRGQIKVIGTK